MWAYYNENDPFAAAWLRNLIKAGLIAPGEVDERSIVDVRPSDLTGFAQCHFFAGIGGWSYALRLAGVPDLFPCWTGSCPCQPFSTAGKRKGFADDRHLWPFFRGLIAERRPPVVFGEQVASAAQWLRLVHGDLEALGYAVGAIPIQAASAGADHLRDRFWFVADCEQRGRESGAEQYRGPQASIAAEDGGSNVGHSSSPGSWGDTRTVPRAQKESNSEWRADGRQLDQPVSSSGVGLADADNEGPQGRLLYTERADQWSAGENGVALADYEGRRSLPFNGEVGGLSGELSWAIGADGKARRVKPGVRLLVDGFPNRVGLLRGFGNAIVPQVAAAFIQAYLG